VDDKLIHEAHDQKTTVQAIADACTKQYLDCLASLGIDTIDRFPKASEHIGEIITLIEKLIAKGHAYASDGNVWFNVATDADYGKLSHRSAEEQEAGTRDLEGAGKRNNADFALWKTAKPGEPMWDSPWGKGRPGWHIECSAMSIKYLGESFDIHGGGLDLQFPHHENELAQSESATDKTFAKYWMHNGLTRKATKLAGGQIRYDKESKSLGNVTDARELITKSGADFVRYLLLSSHYRSPIDNSDDVMAATKKGLATFRRLFERVERLTGNPLPSGEEVDFALPAVLGTPQAEYAGAVLGLKAKFLEAMDDDFNTAGAIAAMHEIASEVNGFIERNALEKNKHPELVAAATAGAQVLQSLGRILGLFNPKLADAGTGGNTDALPGQLMEIIIRMRAELRKAKSFALADQLRKDLTAIGITLEDRAEGTEWKRE
jgi:cysteinyl-tRNA synthetase